MMFVIIILLNNNYTVGTNGVLTITTYTGQVIVSRVIWESTSELFLKPAKDPVATTIGMMQACSSPHWMFSKKPWLDVEKQVRLTKYNLGLGRNTSFSSIKIWQAA